MHPPFTAAMSIIRDPDAASRPKYDLIILGGGIYGAMLALEASLRDLSVLILEKEDFGSATSYNSLKTIHGGLRSLRTLNVKRYREFAGEQRWFLEHFPGLVEPLPVLMPLYQRGLQRTGAFRIAFLLDRLLRHRNRRGTADRLLPRGAVIPASEVKGLFPAVEARRLKGGALWHDAWMPDSQRLIVEILRCACSMGATALNYTPAIDLLKDQHRVVGVCARDALQGADYTFYADVVINATGPWSRENARRFDRDLPDLFRYSIAWNILFDRKALSTHALAVAPPAPGKRLYFLHPWKNRLLVGTGHAPRERRDDAPAPSPEEMNSFLNDINRAVPSLQLKQHEILHVFSGCLPVKKDGTVELTRKACLVDHARHGGPAGLFSISGTRFTAARSTAEKVVSRIFPNRAVSAPKKATLRSMRREQTAANGVFDYQWVPTGLESPWREHLLQIIDNEAVCHLDDLILRRTSLGDNPARSLTMAPMLCQLFDWDDERCQEEIARIDDHFDWMRRSVDASLA